MNKSELRTELADLLENARKVKGEKFAKFTHVTINSGNLMAMIHCLAINAGKVNNALIVPSMAVIILTDFAKILAEALELSDEDCAEALKLAKTWDQITDKADL